MAAIWKGWRTDVISEIRFRQSWRIYLKNIPVTFHHDRAPGFFEEVVQQEQGQQDQYRYEISSWSKNAEIIPYRVGYQDRRSSWFFLSLQLSVRPSVCRSVSPCPCCSVSLAHRDPFCRRRLVVPSHMIMVTWPTVHSVTLVGWSSIIGRIDLPPWWLWDTLVVETWSEVMQWCCFANPTVNEINSKGHKCL